MVRALNLFAKYMYKFSQLASEFFLLVITLLISVDVFSRTVLHRSTLVADELSGYLLVGIGFLGFSYTLKEERHIYIEILVGNFSLRKQEWLKVPAYGVGCIVTAWLTYVTWAPAAAVFATGQRAITVLATPLWIPYSMVPLGSAMLALGFFTEMVNKIVALQDPNYEGKKTVPDWAVDPGV